MKNLTVSLELAKQLKEAGFPQETYFYYDKAFYADKYKLRGGRSNHVHPDYVHSAPTAEEILEYFPQNQIEYDLGHDEIDVLELRIEKNEQGMWFVWFGMGTHYEMLFEAEEESLVEAAGNMFLFLKKEGLL